MGSFNRKFFKATTINNKNAKKKYERKKQTVEIDTHISGLSFMQSPKWFEFMSLSDGSLSDIKLCISVRNQSCKNKEDIIDISNNQYAYLAAYRDSLTFQGVNIDETRKRVVTIAKKKVDGDAQVHLMNLLFRCFELHNDKSIEDPQILLDALETIRAFGLDEKPSSINSLTLNRIQLAFASTCCYFAMKYDYGGLDPKVSRDYPSAMRMAAFAGLIPKEPIGEITEIKLANIKKAFVWHQTNVTLAKFGIKKYLIRKRDLLAHETFINKGIENSIYPASKRVEAMKELIPDYSFYCLESMAAAYDGAKFIGN